jgi:glucokinase
MPLFPTPVLLADVGGTNARFSVVTESGGGLSPMQMLATGGEADFAATVMKAIAEGGYPPPRSFLLAVAGPMEGRSVTLTNARAAGEALAIDGPVLAAALNLDQGLLFNDFEALCMALPVLPRQGLMPLGGGTAIAGEPMLVVGPGTGLGVGALLRKDGVWLPVASEGGHVDIGPRTREDFALWPCLGDSPLSAEDLLSGRGLQRLHSGICRLLGQPMPDDTPAAIAERALAGGDAAADRTIERFFALLARFASDMALTFGARGGVFIGGGIAPRLRDVLDVAAFTAAFEDKGRASAYLRDIPVNLITAPDAALQGLAAVATEPALFALDYAGRCWR